MYLSKITCNFVLDERKKVVMIMNWDGSGDVVMRRKEGRALLTLPSLSLSLADPLAIPSVRTVFIVFMKPESVASFLLDSISSRVRILRKNERMVRTPSRTVWIS